MKSDLRTRLGKLEHSAAAADVPQAHIWESETPDLFHCELTGQKVSADELAALPGLQIVVYKSHAA